MLSELPCAVLTDEAIAVISTDKILECGGHRGNVKTGEKIENQTDFDLGWITFGRSYHSGIAVRSGGFGPGWTHSLDLRLSLSALDMNVAPKRQSTSFSCTSASAT